MIRWLSRRRASIHSERYSSTAAVSKPTGSIQRLDLWFRYALRYRFGLLNHLMTGKFIASEVVSIALEK